MWRQTVTFSWIRFCLHKSTVSRNLSCVCDHSNSHLKKNEIKPARSTPPHPETLTLRKLKYGVANTAFDLEFLSTTARKATHHTQTTSKDRFTLYITFPFHRGKSPFCTIFSCVIKRRCSHWQERLRHVSVPFRSVAVAERERLTWRNRSEPVCTCSIPIMWTVLHLLHYNSSVFL